MTEFARNAEYVKEIGVVRYRCPIDACVFFHDEPTWGPRVVAYLDPATGEIDFESAARKNRADENERIETAMRTHLETHTVDEWVRQVHDMRVRQEQLEAELRAGQVVDGIRPHTYRGVDVSERARRMMAENPPLYPYGLDR